MTFEEFRDADKRYRELQKKSLAAAARRGALPYGSSRARVTTANARWAQAAEGRDKHVEYLERLYNERFPQHEGQS